MKNLLWCAFLYFAHISFCSQPLLNPMAAPNQEERFQSEFRQAASKIWNERDQYYKKASGHLRVRGLCCQTTDEAVLTINIKDNLILQDLKMQYKSTFMHVYGAHHHRMRDFSAFDKEAQERSQEFVDEKTQCCCAVQ